MKAIGLIRVSTLVQDLQQQTDVVKNEMIKDGYVFPDDIILIEDKESAVKLSEEERQGINKMKNYIEKDSTINCVYVFELSRLSRRPEILYSVRDWLIAHHVNLIVLKPYMKLLEDGKLSETASIMFGIFGAMSEQEGFIRKERMRRGKLKAQLEGKSLGNWLPFGYTTDSERHIIIDEEKANLVRKIFTMCVDENKSTTVIARELTETGEFPTKSTIHGHSSSVLNILRNTAYIGKAPFNKKDNKVNYNQYPRIISTELFNKAQLLLSSRKQQPKTNHKNIYYCKGLIKDKNSGRVLRASPAVASYGFASDRLDPIKYKTVTVPINLFDSFAWHLTVEYNKKNSPIDMQKMRAELLKEISLLNKKIDTGKKSLAELDRRIERIQERIISGKMKESLGDKMLSEIYLKQEELLDSIPTWETDAFNKTAYWHATAMIEDEDFKDLSTVTDPEKRYQLIHDAIKEIVVEKGGIPEKGRIRKKGLGVKYGTMEVRYENGAVEQYKFNSYTKKCFTMDDVEVPYVFELRIVGQQHLPGYEMKNKAYRERKRQQS